MLLRRDLLKTYTNYKNRIKRSKYNFYYATSTSIEELAFNFESLIKERGVSQALKILLSITSSTIWVSRSSFKLLNSLVNFSKIHNPSEQNASHQEIISNIINNKFINKKDDEIFKSIYNEILFLHQEDKEIGMKVDLDSTTIVLISGVLNEIFSTAAFEKGAEALFNKWNIPFKVLRVNGLKSSKENSYDIASQINEYIVNDPFQKYYFLCFSKGGVDFLHYLKNYREKLPKQIIGSTFVASPILGSEHINNKLIVLANKLATIPDSLLKKLTGRNSDIFAKELQKSLAKDFRDNWFQRNHELLPKNIFYSAVAFQSKWHEAHVGMMLTKLFFNSSKLNDGVVDVENAQFPVFFKGYNLGILEGHHLIGSRSSFYDQEALLKSILIFLRFKKLL